MREGKLKVFGQTKGNSINILNKKEIVLCIQCSGIHYRSSTRNAASLPPRPTPEPGYWVRVEALESASDFVVHTPLPSYVLLIPNKINVYNHSFQEFVSTICFFSFYPILFILPPVFHSSLLFSTYLFNRRKYMNL
jgi:hypothetical protein